MRFPRSSGILLHPTSLPSNWGIGDLGASAYRFVDWLAEAGQSLWQILPLSPTGYGDSPYQCFSAFAGNPLLISLDKLVEDGLFNRRELQTAPFFSDDTVDYGAVMHSKLPLLRKSFEHLRSETAPMLAQAFDEFCAVEADWLDDYALFMALKEQHDGASWDTWEHDIATREPAALQQWQNKLADQIAVQKYLQYLFFSQWRQLKAYAHEQGIRIIGDAPIFVAYDSADVWAHPDLFYLDADGRPTVVAGVPPDYFSETGQLWGNPLYRWDRMAATGYAWWIAHIKATLELVDIVRLDHFRGFEAYWEVPADETTAVRGRWVKGPGEALFETFERALGELPIIAEDLGVITPPVEALRDRFNLPGMKVLQFAFSSDADDLYLPHNYTRNCIVYTGTHDNDTALGWFNTRDPDERKAVLCYLNRDGSDICWDLIRLAMASVADAAVVPLQDVLRLGSEARQNTPGRLGGNWCWRFRAEGLTPELAGSLREMTATYGRLPKQKRKGRSATADRQL
jgi:4-alpha-glucanotransferase